MNMKKKRGATSIDVLVGINLRNMRNRSGMTQTVLGDKVALTFQQIQKYEKGLNRIAASTLYELALVFGVPVETFYQGVDETYMPSEKALPELSAQALKLAVLYDNSKNAAFKRAVANLIRAVEGVDEVEEID